MKYRSATAGNQLHLPLDGAALFRTVCYGGDRAGRIRDSPIPPDQPLKLAWQWLGMDRDPVLHAVLGWLQQQSHRGRSVRVNG